MNGTGSREAVDDDTDDADDDTLSGVTAELAKESWEVNPLINHSLPTH